MSFNQFVTNDLLEISEINIESIGELVSFLQSNTHIIRLSLCCSYISDEDAKELAKLTNLTSLNLSGCNIDDEGAKELAKLTNLTSLNLSGCNIGDEGVKELAKLTNLTLLNLSGSLFGSSIGDEGVKALANGNFTKLTSLNLYSNKIGDEGLEALIGALNDGKFPKLTQVYVQSSSVSAKVEKQLSDALEPNQRKLQSGSSKNVNTPHSTQENKLPSKNGNSTQESKLPIITASIGLLLGLSIAYLTGAAALTPAIAAVAVFIAAAAAGALLGYGIGKVSGQFSDASISEHDSKQAAAGLI